jgi:hypothetical protein
MINCNVCKSTNVEVRKTEGRGLPPKNYFKRPGGVLISFKGNWELFKCECGNEWKKLSK